QKVIEEAPSPLLDEATRKKMGEQAVALAKAVNYDSAGTVDVVAGQDQSFYFLEMNTRLQVEHPVTELVTGLDQVELMIRVAAGEKLPLKQSDVKLNGWAVESRIYAEDPYRSFLPSIGRLVRYRPPEETVRDGVTVRNDTGVTEGGEISMFYDPMIAKLVTHAPTRLAAIDAQASALDAFHIDGIQHNIPFLTALMQHPRWRDGNLSTGFIAEEFPSGFAPRAPDDAERVTLAMVACVIDQLSNQRRRHISQQLSGNAVSFSQRRVVVIDKTETELDVAQDGEGRFKVTVPDAKAKTPKSVEITSAWWPGEPVWKGTIAGQPVTAEIRPLLNGYRIAWRGLSVSAFVYTAREAALHRLMPEKVAADTSKLLLCPMPGLVKSLNVEAGQEVKAGDPLCTVEAMKMENVLRAERDGIIKTVNAKAGDSLAVDAVIMEFA
ncbi:MAG: biotin/lipoyl-containing protein, partial [Hyphomicrobiaceae bacterium]